MSNSVNLYFTVSIDVEEDDCFQEFSLPRFTTRNIEQIPHLQDVFDRYGVRPTYLLSYPVATDKGAISVFKNIVKGGNCEIGTHPHPWNTPPIEEEINKRNSMLCNLPSELQLAKIKILGETIRNNFDVRPISFRTGRYGFSNDVAKNIEKLGYKIDTSIVPYANMSYIHGPNFEYSSPEPYWFSTENILKPNSNGTILEIPITIGFLQGNSSLCIKINRVFLKEPFRTLKFRQIMGRLGLLNRVWLSPEMFNTENMIHLTEKLIQQGQKIFNMTFHSTSLLAGCSPYTKTAEDEKKLIKNIMGYLDFVKKNRFEPITLSDAAGIIE